MTASPNSAVRLTCPRRLETQPALNFVNNLPEFLTAKRVVIDFSEVIFARPYATLLVADAIKSFVEDRKEIGLTTVASSEGILKGDQRDAIRYLAHVGFFAYMGLDYGKEPGAAPGSHTYVPLTVVTRGELESEVIGKPVQEGVFKRCRHIASLVFKHGSRQDILDYCLREIVRNVFEHGQTDECTLMAQKYSEHEAEIAISDRGVGIYLSLRDAHAVDSAEGAVRLALEPGITRVEGVQTQGNWDNTGFGLYITSRLGKHLGSFAITSSGISLSLTSNSDSVQQTGFPGTAVGVWIDLSTPGYSPNLVDKIVAEGEKAQKSRVARLGASKKL